VSEFEDSDQQEHQEPVKKSGASMRVAIVLVVVAVFAGVFAAKTLGPTRQNDSGTQAASASLTSVRNDASADYNAAIKTGKPVYVLFHSLS